MTDTDDLLARAEAFEHAFGEEAGLVRGLRAEVERLQAERDLLAQALGSIAVKAGVVEDVPLTGPQLLLAARDVEEELQAAGDEADRLEAIFAASPTPFGGTVTDTTNDLLAKAKLVADFLASIHNRADAEVVIDLRAEVERLQAELTIRGRQLAECERQLSSQAGAIRAAVNAYDLAVSPSSTEPKPEAKSRVVREGLWP